MALTRFVAVQGKGFRPILSTPAVARCEPQTAKVDFRKVGRAVVWDGGVTLAGHQFR
jgi:hypothetical protein